MSAVVVAPGCLLPREQSAFYWHHDAENALLSAWQGHRLPHAILFTGPRGIGKATLAFRFARFVLCGGKAQDTGMSLFGDEPSAGLEVDMHLPAVRRITNNSHTDLLVLETKFDEKKGKERKEITVDEARQVIEFLSLTPAEAEWRVVIVDSIDNMNRHAANALLKVMEEPPKQTVMLLVSHNPGQLLPTIRSRCRTMKMTLPDRAHFGDIIRVSNPTMENEAIDRLHYLSHGSPGLALTMMHVDTLAIYNRLLEVFPGGVISMHTALSFAESFAAKDGSDDWQVLQYLMKWLLAGIVAASSHGYLREEIIAGEHELVQKLAHKKPLASWLDLNDTLAQSFADADHLHLDRKHTLLTLLHALAGE